MAQKLDEVTNKFFQNIIKTSWTWQRLTEEEKSRFENLDIFCEISGTKDMREQWLFTIYAGFLAGLEYDGTRWRWVEKDKKDSPLF